MPPFPVDSCFSWLAGQKATDSRASARVLFVLQLASAMEQREGDQHLRGLSLQRPQPSNCLFHLYLQFHNLYWIICDIQIVHASCLVFEQKE